MTVANERPTPTNSRRALHIVTALAAVWLFISPWVLAYGTADAWNTWVASVIIFLIALSSLNQPSIRKDQATLVLGVWMFISPWVFAFSNPTAGASWNQWLVGALVFLLSAGHWAAERNAGAVGMRHA